MQQTFAAEIATGVLWGENERLLFIWEGEQWVGSIELGERIIRVGDTPLKVGTVGGVMTLPDFRGRGYASAAMRRAVEYCCDEIRAAFGVLYCGLHRVTFYEALGWRRVPGPVWYDHAGEPRALPPEFLPMIYACADDRWPEGAIDVCGAPW